MMPSHKWHGIIVDESQKDRNIFKKLEIIGSRVSSANKWTLYKISADDRNLPSLIKELRKNLKDRYYFHFYKGEKVIVVFKGKIFHLTTDKSTWKEAVGYGIALGIPKGQMDMNPCRKEEETY